MPRTRPGARTCTECGLTQTVCADQVCLGCKRAATPAAEAKCIGCGGKTVREDRVCKWCQVHFDRESPDFTAPDPKNGLGDGSWRFDPFRRVQVWVPAPVIVAPPVPKNNPRGGLRKLDVTDTEARRFFCEHCCAKPGMPCVEVDGCLYKRGSHRPRRLAAEAARERRAA